MPTDRSTPSPPLPDRSPDRTDDQPPRPAKPKPRLAAKAKALLRSAQPFPGSD